MLFRALIVDFDKQFIVLMTQNLMRMYEVNPLHVSNAHEAISLFKTGQTFDVIISKDKLGEELTTQMLVAELYEKQSKTYLFIIGDTPQIAQNLISFPGKFRIEEFNRTLIKSLGLTSEQLKDAKLSDYVPIPIKSFYFIKIPCCDIYIKLRKKDENQFIKRFLMGESFDPNIIKRYEEQGLGEMYLQKENKEIFFNQLMKCNSDQNSLETGIVVASHKYELQKEILNKCGVNEVTMAMASIYIKELQEIAFQKKKLGIFLKDLSNKETSYGYKNVQLICFLAALTLPKVDIGKGKFFENAMEKISAAAFLHDLLLLDDSHIAINSKLELQAANLDEKTSGLVLNHADLMANIIQSQNCFPSEVEIIVRQHHGAPLGIGFVETGNISLGAHTILFIVLEEFSRQILCLEQNKSEMGEIFNSVYQKYNMPSYKKVIDALKVSLV